MRPRTTIDEWLPRNSDFDLEIQHDEGRELDIVVLKKGSPSGAACVVCRIQLDCIRHVFDDAYCDCREQVDASLAFIRRSEKPGLLIYVRPRALVQSATAVPRQCAAAAAVLGRLAIGSVHLLSLDRTKAEAIEEEGIDIVEISPPNAPIVGLGRRYQWNVQRVRDGLAASPLFRSPERRHVVLVIGDLNVDRSPAGDETVGGSGFFPALAFRSLAGYQPVVVGTVGDDEHGRAISSELRNRGIWSLLATDPEKSTGLVEYARLGAEHTPFQYNWDKRNNANGYDVDALEQALDLMQAERDDIVHLSSYMFVQKGFDEEEIARVLDLLSRRSGRVVLDLTRKTFSPDVQREFGAAFDGDAVRRLLARFPVFCVVAETSTLERLGFGLDPDDKDRRTRIHTTLCTRWIVRRHPTGSQTIHIVTQYDENRGGLSALPHLLEQTFRAEMELGESDVLTAKALRGILDWEQANP